MDIATLTNTAQAIADMKLNGALTLFLVAIIGIVNVVALFIPKK